MKSRVMKRNRHKQKTEWDLRALYASPNDPKIESDVKRLEARAKEFNKKYNTSRAWLGSPNELNKVLQEYEDIVCSVGTFKPLLYFSYLRALGARKSEYDARIALLTPRAQHISNLLLFFELELAKLDGAVRQKFLKAGILVGRRYLLKRIFDSAKHNLTLSEEKIMNLKSQTSYDMWVEVVERILSSKTVLYKGKKIPLPQAQNLIPQLSLKDRRLLHVLLNDVYKEIAPIAEAEINAIVINKKTNDELRAFEKPYSQTVLSYQNDPKTVEVLVKTVTDNFSISKDFYAIKAKLLGVKKLTYADRTASIGSIKRSFKFDEATKIVRDSFAKAHPEFAEVLDDMLKMGNIDAFPKAGKQGGAFCSSGYKTPIYVLLNHTNSFNDVRTYAHEMGHAIHAHYSRGQRPLYSGHSYATAEIASTLFENFVFDAVFDSLNESEKKIALHDKLNSSVSTVFRQVACFNFENQLHTAIRKNGYLSKEEIASLLKKNLEQYMGPVMKLIPDDGYFFVTWSHIRRFFYVYSYAFGELVSNAMYAEYKGDPKFINKIIEFLKAGESDTPENILRGIGIDVTLPNFFLQGLNEIKSEMLDFKQIV